VLLSLLLLLLLLLLLTSGVPPAPLAIGLLPWP
jgi:hypothetical protein